MEQEELVRRHAFERDRTLAEEGDAEAQYSLALHYIYNEDMPANYKEAGKWLRLAAEQDHCEAQFNLGCLYLFGKGVQVDYEEAISWLKKAVATGNPTYQFRLGYAYYCLDDYCEAAKWIRLSAEQGESYAQVSLGSLYLHGTGVIKDEEEAIKWFKLAAEQGNTDAKFEVMNYCRRKAGFFENTKGYEDITSKIGNPVFRKSESDIDSFSSKVIEMQDRFEEEGIQLELKDY